MHPLSAMCNVRLDSGLAYTVCLAPSPSDDYRLRRHVTQDRLMVESVRRTAMGPIAAKYLRSCLVDQAGNGKKISRVPAI